MLKRFFLLSIALLVVLVASAKDYKYVTVPGDPMQTRIYTLDNGLKVYLSVNKETPRVTAYIAVNTGHRNDPADCTGLAHYLEHLMFKGSHKLGTSDYNAEVPLINKISDLYEEYRKLTDPAERKAKYHEIDSVSQLAAQYNIPNEYDKMMAAIGSVGTNAHTWYDETIYKEDIPSNEIQRWAEVQADRFQNLVLRGFHTELEAVYEEKNIAMTKDSRKILEAYMAKMFPSHSYGTQTTIGTQDHLKNPSLVAIQNYYKKYYVPNNVAICMAGDIVPEDVIAVIDKEFGSWKAGKDISPRQFPEQPKFTCPQDTTVVGLEQETVYFGWRFDGTSSLQSDTLNVVANVLCNGRAGLLDLNVNQQMLTQGTFAEILSLKDYSTLLLGGSPKDGQTLDEVRDIVLAEIEKLKRGDFDDDLLEAINNNAKRDFYRGLDSNLSRVSSMYRSFINEVPWEQEVNKLQRRERISKADVMAFAKKYLDNGYVISYKRKGEDANIKKIEKPQITPIPANRDKSSRFLSEMTSRNVEPIQPVFVDFDKDLTESILKTKQPVLYVQNTNDDLFTLAFRYEFGDRADVRYAIASEYAELLGTSKYTNAELKKQFYKIACDYNISVGNRAINITVSGLNVNMPKALELLDQILTDSKVDADVYKSLVDMSVKERVDAKLNQQKCFNFLYQYGLHGAKNDYTNMETESALRSANPQDYVDLLKKLKGYEHTVLYYGPSSLKELSNVIKKNFKPSKKFNEIPKNASFDWVQTPTSEIIIAPYKANNINMRMIHNEGNLLDVSRIPVVTLFNEYFGGGMNSIVFQELRESRGLAYNANARFYVPSRQCEPEYWMQHIISQNDKMIDCINTFKEITDSMPVSENAFEIARQGLIKTLASERVRKFGVISSYLAAKEMGVDDYLHKKLYEALPTMTLKDIVDFEKTNIKGKPLRYVILGNPEELDIPALEKIAPVKIVSLEEIFGY